MDGALPRWFVGFYRVWHGRFHAPGAGILLRMAAKALPGLRAYRDYRDLCDKIRYWTPAARRETEVDFILSRGARRVAVKAKASERFSDTWCRGLRALSELPGLVRRILVYPNGPQLRTDDGIKVMPLRMWADSLAKDTVWNPAANAGAAE
jgi:predicted AAA+ superfamily ATPase